MLLLKPGSLSLLLTPERQISEEDISIPPRGAIAAIRTVRNDGSFLGGGGLEVFRFEDTDDGPLDAAELAEWVHEASTLGNMDSNGPQGGNLIAQAIDGNRGQLVAQPADSGGQNLIGDAIAASGGAAAPPIRWTLCESVGTWTAGTIVDPNWPTAQLGDKGVAQLPNGLTLFIHKVTPEVSGAKSSGDVVKDGILLSLEHERADSRVLPIKYDILGHRALDFKCAIDKCVPHRAEDYPMSGPPSCLWLLKHMYSNGGTPTSFHQRFLSDTRLDYSAGGMTEHMTICKAFEIFTSYDQLDVSRLAGCELMARKLQIIHEKWRHKMPNLSPGSTGVEEDSYLLLGTTETRGNLGVCPELSVWLGSELSKQALADKERRKAREERALQTKK